MKDKQLDELCKEYLNKLITTEYLHNQPEETYVVLRSAISNSTADNIISGDIKVEDALKYMVNSLIKLMITKGPSKYTFKRTDGSIFREIDHDDQSKAYELRLVGWNHSAI